MKKDPVIPQPQPLFDNSRARTQTLRFLQLALVIVLAAALVFYLHDIRSFVQTYAPTVTLPAIGANHGH